jgi:hypothetical protein
VMPTVSAIDGAAMMRFCTYAVAAGITAEHYYSSL